MVEPRQKDEMHISLFLFRRGGEQWLAFRKCGTVADEQLTVLLIIGLNRAPERKDRAIPYLYELGGNLTALLGSYLSFAYLA